MAKVPPYFFEQSGVIPYRLKNGKLQIMLITSTSKSKWILPKGVTEPFMSPQESAAQEAFEEAGITGEVSPNPAGTYKVEKWGGTCTVTLYPMNVTTVHKDWAESFFRDRKWMPAKKAAESISKKQIRKIVSEFISTFKF